MISDLFNLFVHLFLAVLGLNCCVGFSLVAASRDCSLAVVCGLLVAVASLVVEHKLQNPSLGFTSCSPGACCCGLQALELGFS